MPSFSNDVLYLQSATKTTNSLHIDPQQGIPQEKTSVSNTFLWMNWPNGDSNHLDAHQNDHRVFTNLKNGSAYSINTSCRTVSSHTRDGLKSKDGDMLSLSNGTARDPHDIGRALTTPDGDLTQDPLDAEHGPNSKSQANGVPLSQHPLSGKPAANDDHLPMALNELASTDPAHRPQISRLSSSQPEETVSLSPGARSTIHRYSSPPAPSNLDSVNAPAPADHGLRHRHTLQVPRPSSTNRSSRDHSEEAYSTGRLTPSSGKRRASTSLARRATKSAQSDMHPDVTTPDEETTRWAEAVKQRRASKRKRRDDEDDDRVIVGTKVDHNHVNWVTAYNMLTGIRFTVSRINAKMDRELTSADFKAKHKFSFDITGNELTPSAKYDFKFKDYAPWVFRHLRAKFRLDPADYLMSLTSKYILSELGSPGKSGSFFYFSRDYKYIIKTIHHSEHKLLRKILPEYYKHVDQNPNTLISQFYGLHRVKMAYGRKIHFVVMNNLFPPHRDIHQTFDLKGSTIGRDLVEEDLKKNPRATLKDLNWIRRNRCVQCGPGKREFFLAQLKRDVALLKRLNIMDYSLLVGIHDLERGNEEKLRDKTLQVFQPGGEREEELQHPNMLMRTPSKLENERKARELRMLIKRERPVPLDKAAAKMPEEILDERKFHVFYSDDGGFRATHEGGQAGEEIYYLGIIDCLTEYGTTKKFEHFFKSLSHDHTQISPIPPDNYADRFISFIKGVTMSKEESERRQKSRGRGRQVAEQTTTVERRTQAIEKGAAKDVSQTHPRTLSTVREPGEAPGLPTSTLPIVDEAGEASSTGGQSQQSRQDSPPATERELPPILDEDDALSSEKGKERAVNGQNDSGAVQVVR